MTRKKILLTLIITLISACFFTGIVLLCVLNIALHRVNDVVISQENGIVSFKAQNQSKGYGYTFRFKSNDKQIDFDSGLDLFVLDEEAYSNLTVGEKYIVSVSVKGEIEGGNSDFSKGVEWTAVKYLQSPQLQLYSTILSWEEIENADYYEVFYSGNAELRNYTTSDNYLPLEVLDGGVSDIFITALSNKSYFLTSESSNVLTNVNIIHELKAFRDVQFNQAKKLTIYSYEEIDQIDLYLGNDENSYSHYKLTDFEITLSAGFYKITCLIDFIYNGEAKIGATPSSSKAYNKYTGNIYWISA